MASTLLLIRNLSAALNPGSGVSAVGEVTGATVVVWVVVVVVVVFTVVVRVGSLNVAVCVVVNAGALKS